MWKLGKTEGTGRIKESFYNTVYKKLVVESNCKEHTRMVVYVIMQDKGSRTSQTIKRKAERRVEW